MTRLLLLFALSSLGLIACATPAASEIERLQRARAADVAFKSGDVARAKRLYRTLAQERRGAENAHVRLGAIAYRQGERALAKQHFEQALKANAAYAPAAYNLAILSLDQSIDYLQRYVEHTNPGADRDRVIELMRELEQFARTSR